MMLFLFTCIFLLTMVRAAYVLWQFPKVVESNALLSVFYTGLRFDLALIGILLVPVLVLGSIFGIFNGTRKLAKFFVAALLMLSMVFILVTELITPYFMAEQGIRPDLAVLTSIEDPVKMLAGLWSSYLIPAVVGLILVTLIVIAYWARLETNRMFRFPMGILSTLLLLVVGLGLCALAMYSGIDLSLPPLSPTNALISAETIVNEISMNTGFKMLYSLVAPFLG